MGYKQKKYKNGEEYNGEWNNNKRHGMGVHQWPDNRVYEGQFKDDLMHGHGKYQWPDNRLYEGSFVQDHMTGRGYYFQDKRDPLLEEISGEFLNGVLHGRGVCFKKIITNNITTGLIITVGYCWNRGTLHHGFEIIVDTNNMVQSIKQFKSNCKYSFDPRGGGIDYFQDDSGGAVVAEQTLHSPNAATSLRSASTSQDKLNGTNISNSVPLLNLMNISTSSATTADSISPRFNTSTTTTTTATTCSNQQPQPQGSITPRTRSSPRTPRNGSHLIKPSGTTEIKIDQIEFIDASELAQAKAELLEKQSNLVQAWKEKLNNVQEKIKALSKQKANLESKLAEAKEELTFYHNKDIETEQRLSQYITQHKELFEEYEIATNSKIQTLETIISELNERRERDLTLKNQELENLRNSLHKKIESLELEWKDRYNRLECQVELLDDDKKMQQHQRMDDLNKKSSTNIYRTSDENNTKSTTVEEDIKSMTTTSSNDDNDDARLISNTENQHLINSIALSPHRPVTRHRRSISNIHHAHLPSSLVEQHASSRDSSPSSSTSPISHDLNMTNGQATTTTPNTSSTIHSPPPEDDFDIETTLRTTAYKTATNVANTPSYETAQQKETKNIGRPRSNSQDNSSVTSSLDIVRGTITGSQLLSASSNASSSSSSSNNLNQAAGDPNTTNSTLKDSQSERTNSLKSEQDAQMSSSALSRVTESSEQSFSYQSQSNYQQHQQQPPLSPLQKHSSLSSIPSSSSLTEFGENSTKIKTHQTSMDKNGAMGNNKSMLPNQSNWISADILYQKIRENLKKTSNFAELENSSKSVNKEQIDYRQVLKKKH